MLFTLVLYFALSFQVFAQRSDAFKQQTQMFESQTNLLYFLIVIIFIFILFFFSIQKHFYTKKRLYRELELKVLERTNELSILNNRLNEELKEKKRAEQTLRLNEERYRYLYESNPAPMYIYETETLHFLSVNEAFEKYYGYQKDEIMKMDVSQIHPPDERRSITERLQQLKGYAYSDNWHHVKQDGTVISTIIVSHELIYLEKNARVAVVTDITERSKIEMENIHLNQTLEDRVSERTAQLRFINKELESFSYSISHDLRAPLRAIYGFSEILSSRHREFLNAEGCQYLDYIVEASVHMEQLINDLLEFSRLGMRILNLKSVNMDRFIDTVLLDFKQKTDEIEAIIHLDEQYPTIKSDESMLRQIFSNLIDNAIKYRRMDVPLEIGIHCERKDSSWYFIVSDNGIGISAEHKERIFTLFQRLHNDYVYPGTGIGLANVRKAVSMLNGRVWVESVVGKGSVFYVELPDSINFDKNGKNGSHFIS